MQPLVQSMYTQKMQALLQTLEAAVLGQMHEVMFLPGDDESRA